MALGWLSSKVINFLCRNYKVIDKVIDHSWGCGTPSYTIGDVLFFQNNPYNFNISHVNIAIFFSTRCWCVRRQLPIYIDNWTFNPYHYSVKLTRGSTSVTCTYVYITLGNKSRKNHFIPPPLKKMTFRPNNWKKPQAKIIDLSKI